MYSFLVSDRKVVCSSTYAGKPVVGVAKCAPEDVFNVEYGKKLARLRCDLKVAKKRLKSEHRKFETAYNKMNLAQAEVRRRIRYMRNASNDINACEKAISLMK